MTTPESPHSLPKDVHQDTKERSGGETDSNQGPHYLWAGGNPPINQKEAHSVAKEALESIKSYRNILAERTR